MLRFVTRRQLLTRGFSSAADLKLKNVPDPQFYNQLPVLCSMNIPVFDLIISLILRYILKLQQYSRIHMVDSPHGTQVRIDVKNGIAIVRLDQQDSKVFRSIFTFV